MKTDKTYENLMELGADSVTEIKKYIIADEQDWEIHCGIWKEKSKNGNQLAWLEAIIISYIADKPAPDWSVDDAISFVGMSIKKGVLNKRGRGNSIDGIKERHSVKSNRCHMVGFILFCQKEENGLSEAGWESIEEARETFNSLFDTQLTDFGNTLEDACNIASKLLRGTESQGEPDAIARDWRARDQLWGMSDRVSVGTLTELHNGFQRK